MTNLFEVAVPSQGASGRSRISIIGKRSMVSEICRFPSVGGLFGTAVRATSAVKLTSVLLGLFVLAGVTNHGDGEVEFDIPVPADLCNDPPTVELDRMGRIREAIRTFTGRRTRRGKPYVRDLRRHAGIDDITVAERNAAFKAVKA